MSPVPAGGSLYERFADVAASTPDAVALVAGERRMTYDELHARSRELAGRLLAAGAEPDRPVAVVADKSGPEWVVAALACWSVHAAYTPIDRDLQPTVVARMLAASAATVLVGPPDAVAPVAGPLPVVALDTRLPPGRPVQAPPVRRPHPDTTAYVLHTSGTTGVPRAVAVGHGSLTAAYTLWEPLHRLRRDTRVHLQVSSLGFDVHVADLARALLSGGTLVLCPVATVIDPPALHALIGRTGVDQLDVTPTVLRLLVAWARETGARLPVRRVIIGGERWTAADLARLRQVTGPDTVVLNMYGLVETTVDSTVFDTAGLRADTGDVPIGRPVPGTSALVLDTDLRPVADGAAGELFLVGPNLARGYLNRPAETAARFLPLPDGLLAGDGPGAAAGARMFATGDRVSRDADGVLTFLGRVDDELKIDGVRVSPGGVEAVLADHPAVTAAVVVADPAGGGHRLVAHVAVDPDRHADPGLAERIRTHVADALPPAMVPARVHLHRCLPVNAAGKVDRAALRVADDGSPAGIRPGSPEARLADLWARVLGRRPRDVTEDFFAAGGTSMALARFAMLVRSDLGRALPLTALYGAPTVADQARLLAGATTADPVPAAAAPDGPAPLAPDQRRLWLLHRLAPDGAAYTMPTLVRLRGAVRLDLLTRAVETLVARHEALRTAFVDGPTGPVQRILPPGPVPVEVVDLSDLPAHARPAAAERAVRDRIRQPFDLTEGRPLRVAVVRHDADRADLVVTVHHIVFDAWSEQVLWRELGTVYRALHAGHRPALPALPLRYVDLAAGLAAGLVADRPDIDAQRRYWRRVLADPPPPLTLCGPAHESATDRPSPSDEETGRVRHGEVTRVLEGPLARRVRDRAAAARTSRPVVLLAALAALLIRWTGERDLVIGLPFGDRDRPETRDMVGFLVRSLPLRLTVAEGATFAELTAVAHRALTEGTAHADVPFDTIVHDAGLSGSGQRNPLFTVWFNAVENATSVQDFGDATAELVDAPAAGALFPFGWYVHDGPDTVRLRLVHDLDALPDADAAEALDQYERLLGRVCAEPDRPIEEHPLRPLPAGGTTDLLASRAQPRPLVPTLRRAATTHAHRWAVAGPDRIWTYADLWARAEGVAARLRAAGTRPAAVVAVLGGRRVELAAAVLGVLLADAVFTVLDTDLPPDVLAGRLRRTAPTAGIAMPGVPMTPALRQACPQWIDLAVAEGTEPSPDATTRAGTDAGAAGYLLFTSGTTGEPKPVRGTTAAVSHFLDWYVERFGIGPADRFAMLSGLGYDPLLRDVFTPLWVGATLHVPPARPARSPVDLLAWMRRDGITVAHLTPALCRLLSRVAGARTVPSLRLLCSGGDQLTGDDVAGIRSWAPAATVVNGYGTTETPQLASYHVVDPGHPPTGAVPVGSGAPGWEVLVLDPVGRPAAAGERGPVVVRGAYLAGDTGDPGRFQPDPVPGHRRFRTGDLGRHTPDGGVVLLGRLDDQVKVLGHRVELGEIDRHLRACPGVADAASAVRPGPDGENEVVAGLVPGAGSDGPPPTTDRLRALLRRWLPPYLLPARTAVIGSVPLTPNGKVDRAALLALVAAAAEPRPAARRPAGGLTAVVAGAWGRALGRDDIGVGENFFDAGGSSMLITRVHADLERELDRAIPVTAMFEYPTVRDLAAFLAAGDAPVTGPVHVDAVRRPAPDLRARRLAARETAQQKENRT